MTPSRGKGPGRGVLCPSLAGEAVSFQQIWAPWRLSYIVGEEGEEKDQGAPGSDRLRLLEGADPKCFICQATADPDNPKRYVVQQNGLCITILNRYPYNNGHLLVAPRLHKSCLEELTAEEHLALSQALARMVQALTKVLRPEGFNVGMNLGRVAGAGLPEHLHWHIVPRWQGDTNFMAALAAVKVIPQSLEALWEVLRAELGRRDAQSARNNAR